MSPESLRKCVFLGVWLASVLLCAAFAFASDPIIRSIDVPAELSYIGTWQDMSGNKVLVSSNSGDRCNMAFTSLPAGRYTVYLRWLSSNSLWETRVLATVSQTVNYLDVNTLCSAPVSGATISGETYKEIGTIDVPAVATISLDIRKTSIAGHSGYVAPWCKLAILRTGDVPPGGGGASGGYSPAPVSATVSGSSITATWSAVTGATGYVVDLRNSTQVVTSASVGSGTLTYTFNNVGTGTYFVRVTPTGQPLASYADSAGVAVGSGATLPDSVAGTLVSPSALSWGTHVYGNSKYKSTGITYDQVRAAIVPTYLSGGNNPLNQSQTINFQFAVTYTNYVDASTGITVPANGGATYSVTVGRNGFIFVNCATTFGIRPFLDPAAIDSILAGPEGLAVFIFNTTNVFEHPGTDVDFPRAFGVADKAALIARLEQLQDSVATWQDAEWKQYVPREAQQWWDNDATGSGGGGLSSWEGSGTWSPASSSKNASKGSNWSKVYGWTPPTLDQEPPSFTLNLEETPIGSSFLWTWESYIMTPVGGMAETARIWFRACLQIAFGICAIFFIIKRLRS